MSEEQQKAEAYLRKELGEELIHRQAFRGVYPKQPQLQHWLRVLGTRHKISCKGDGTAKVWVDQNAHILTLRFDLTTGQPATEADYKAFNDIVGV